MVDKRYCMSSFLQFRTIADNNRSFTERSNKRQEDNGKNGFSSGGGYQPISTAQELHDSLKKTVEQTCKDTKTALALSGGIDSAILAKFMPKGSIVYTFKCVVPGMSVTDETAAAAAYAEECGLEQRVVEVYWEDFEKYSPVLMKHKGAPIHSIEAQIYKAALQALQDGMETFIFGESSDVNYGGLSGLLSRDWSIGEFYDRYSYVKPYQVLKDFEVIMDPYREYERDGMIDVHEFCRGFFLNEGKESYINACSCAGIEVVMPYLKTRLAKPLDIERVRRGENKYIVREVFEKLYPDFEIPPKTPMPRPMNEWMRDWTGPKREEFWPHCTDYMTGDQKWLVWVLEKYLDMIEA